MNKPTGSFQMEKKKPSKDEAHANRNWKDWGTLKGPGGKPKKKKTGRARPL